MNRLSILFAGTAAAILAGCAVGGSSPQQQSSAQSLNVTTYPLGAYGTKPGTTLLRSAHAAHATPSYHVDRTSQLVYVSNLGEGAIDVFDQKGKDQTPIATITDGILGPGGLTTDKKGNLYVADEGPISGQWTVQVYAPGTTSPAKSYTTDLDSPTDTAVAKDGTIYIANFNGLSNGWVAVYPKGDVSKEYRLSDFGGGAPLSVALDAKGNLFVLYDIHNSTKTLARSINTRPVPRPVPTSISPLARAEVSRSIQPATFWWPSNSIRRRSSSLHRDKPRHPRRLLCPVEVSRLISR